MRDGESEFGFPRTTEGSETNPIKENFLEIFQWDEQQLTSALVLDHPQVVLLVFFGIQEGPEMTTNTS